MRKLTAILTILTLLTVMYNCKKPYNPPPAEDLNTILVVEGTIAVGTGAENRFLLSRLRPLQDTTLNDPESGARIIIESQSGGGFPLSETAPGTYNASLTLSSSAKYRLKILTRNGRQYETDYLAVKSTPPIDSLSWKQPGDLEIYVHTHDPSNNTRYYRWEYVDTWEYHAFYDSNLKFENGRIVFIPPSQQIYACWSSGNSESIILGNTKALSEDLVSYQPILTLPKPSEKASVKYSVLVRQIGLTEDAYQFWSILRKNTELTGTLFDPQPSQLPGNIRCVSNPGEKVIGYVSAGVVTESRIFVDNTQLFDWPPPAQENTCQPLDTPDPIAYMAADTSYGPAYFVTGGGLMLAKKACLDCLRRGGSNQKPPFWR